MGDYYFKVVMSKRFINPVLILFKLRMKAAIFEGNKRKLDLVEVCLPTVGDDEALLRVAYTGLCQTDVKKIWHNLLGLRNNDPRIFGHEITGEIVDIGKNVTTASIGDRVALFHHVPCENCEPCSNKRYAQCETYKNVDTSAGYGRASGGGFAEYVRIPSLVLAKGVIPIPDGIKYEDAVFIEPLNCALKAVRTFERYAPIQKDEPVLVVGQGHQGLIFDQLINLSGGRAIATDNRNSRVRRGAKFAETYHPRDVKKIAEEIGGFEKAVISAASSKAIDFGLKMMKEKGVAVYFGDLMPNNEYWSYHSRHEIPVEADGKLVVPSYSSSFLLHQEAADLIFNRKIDLSSMITQKIGLSDLEAAIGGAVKGFLRKGFSTEEVSKILVDPGMEKHQWYSVPSLNDFLIPAAGLAGLMLIASVMVKHHLKFNDCESINNWNGTQSYICPTKIDCGDLKSWEGERQDITEDGRTVCTYWFGGN